MHKRLSYKHSIGFDQIFKNGGQNIFDFLPKNERSFTTSSGRGGLELCIKILKLTSNDTVLLPAFSPEGIISPFLKNNINIDCYHSNKSLLIDVVKLDKKLSNDVFIKVVVVVHFFGFQQPIGEVKKICKKHNVILIEDCAHTLYSISEKGVMLGTTGDISFFSLNKILPVPDGAVFFINNENIKYKTEQYKYSSSIIHLISTFMNLINLILMHWIRNKNNFLYKLGNLILSGIYGVYYLLLRYMKKPSSISNITKKILSNIDYILVFNSIKRNADYFYGNINSKKLNLINKSYSKDMVLMGIPIFVDNRSAYLDKLMKKGIVGSYFKYFWQFLPGDENKNEFESEYYFMKKHIMIPVNENITFHDIEYIVETVNTL